MLLWVSFAHITALSPQGITGVLSLQKERGSCTRDGVQFSLIFTVHARIKYVLRWGMHGCHSYADMHDRTHACAVKLFCSTTASSYMIDRSRAVELMYKGLISRRSPNSTSSQVIDHGMNAINSRRSPKPRYLLGPRYWVRLTHQQMNC
jgi:hypothetical protein